MKLRAFAMISVTLGLIFFAYKAGQSSKITEIKTSAPPTVPTATIAIDRLRRDYPKPAKDEGPPQKIPSRDQVVIRGQIFYTSAFGLYMSGLKNVNLTSEQVDQMQDVYNIVYEARLNYEHSKATVGEVGSRTVVEIPSYEAFGTQLRSAMFSTFVSILGKDTASVVNEQLGIRFDVANAYWGKYPQTIAGQYDQTYKVYNITHVINPRPSKPDGFQQMSGSTLSVDGLGIYSGYFSSRPQSK